MKKNYLEPVIKVQSVALQNMIAMSTGIAEKTESGETILSHDRSDLLDDWNL